jgi:acetyl-CoA synthetase
MNAEDPLFILYTSGSTGKPKGVLHTTGGYLVFASMTHQYVFDYHDGDIYWCTADVGWVTGHSYILYGPLANGATTLMFEGVPNYPSMSRFWEVIDKHKVNIFYTAPTAIRALMQAGDEPVKKTSRKSLRLLGSVGEPINPEAWEWYYHVVGEARAPIVDTWWQTETGGILITPLPGATKLKPGSATRPFFGVARDRRCRRQGAGRRDLGQSLHRQVMAGPDAHGLWRPQALRTDLFLDLQEQVLHRRRLPPRRRRLLLDHRPRRRRHQRLRPPHGHGRSGIALVAHEKVSEAAVVGYPHDIKGQGIYAYVTLMNGVEPSEELRKELVAWVRKDIGPIASPDLIQFAPGLPKDPLRQDHAPHPAQDRRGRTVISG